MIVDLNNTALAKEGGVVVSLVGKFTMEEYKQIVQKLKTDGENESMLEIEIK